MISQVGKWFSRRGPENCWKGQKDILPGREQTEKGTQRSSVWSVDGPLGDLTGTGDQPSGEVFLERGAGYAKETTSTE